MSQKTPQKPGFLVIFKVLGPHLPGLYGESDGECLAEKKSASCSGAEASKQPLFDEVEGGGGVCMTKTCPGGTCAKTSFSNFDPSWWPQIQNWVGALERSDSKLSKTPPILPRGVGEGGAVFNSEPESTRQRVLLLKTA